ncbi:MAG TPA: hypothetical protein VD997_08230 [Phycisphaerales bacterium]|nr:hypothetical protein [Phycisphaerales bacterium]
MTAHRSRCALLVPCVLAALVTTAGHARAQVNALPYPNHNLNVSAGWSGGLVGNSAFGAGFNNAGAFGQTTISFDPTPGPTWNSLQSSNVYFAGFYANGNPSGPGTITVSGQMDFVPIVTCQYTIGGNIPLAFNGALAAASISGQMSLAQLSGVMPPTLATYSTSPAYAPNSSATLFDAASPAFGAASGLLTGGETYRWSFSFTLTRTAGNDPLAEIVATQYQGAPPSLSLSFAVIPAPGAPALLGLAALLVTRRRR